MPNPYYTASGAPSQGSTGSSAVMRAEFLALVSAFDKMPTLSGNGSKLVRVNAGATGLEAFTHDFLSTTTAASTYATIASLSSYLTTASAAATYATIASLGSYLTTAAAASTYVAKAGDTMTGALLGIAGAVGAPGFAFSGDANTGFWSPAADTLAWSAGGSEVFRAISTGIGIGVAPSANRLQVSGLSEFNSGAAGVSVSVCATSQTATRWQFGVNSSSQFRIFENVAGIDRLTLSVNGNWVLATPASGAALTINGASSVTTLAVAATELPAAVVSTASVALSARAWEAGARALFGTTTNHPLHVRVNDTDRLTIATTGKSTFAGGAFTTTNTQVFSATPTFDANLSNIFEMGALTANVTSCTITNPSNGQTISIRVIQDGTGGRTFAAPAGSKIVGSIGATASAASILTLTYSAANTRWEGSWLALPA